MVSRRSGARTTTLVATGVVGVFLAHVLDYLLVFRSAGHRAHELAATGHGWLPAALTAAIGAGALAGGMALGRGGAKALMCRTTTRRRAIWRDYRALALWQVGLFSAVEVIERLASHQSPLELVHGLLFPSGLGLQLLVAAVLMALLCLFERLGVTLVSVVADAARQPRRGRRPVFARPGGQVLLGLTPGGSAPARAPPHLFAA
jgi:hypothetical protein